MIFNLFRSKPTLKELIPNGFVDIHSHILPGIDDGAKNVDESVILIENMKDMGFSKVIGTPHTYPGLYNNTNASISESFKKLKNKAKKGINIEFASEYMIDESLIEKAEKRELLTISEKYVLIEMSFSGIPKNALDIIFKLQMNNYVPILAHPERYTFLNNDFKKFYKFKNAGCKFQINLLSLTGDYGKTIVKLSDKLIKNNLIDFSGSDIHNINYIKKFQNKLAINNIKLVENIMLKNSEIFN